MDMKLLEIGYNAPSNGTEATSCESVSPITENDMKL